MRSLAKGGRRRPGRPEFHARLLQEVTDAKASGTARHGKSLGTYPHGHAWLPLCTRHTTAGISTSRGGGLNQCVSTARFSIQRCRPRHRFHWPRRPAAFPFGQACFLSSAKSLSSGSVSLVANMAGANCVIKSSAERSKPIHFGPTPKSIYNLRCKTYIASRNSHFYTRVMA